MTVCNIKPLTEPTAEKRECKFNHSSLVKKSYLRGDFVFQMNCGIFAHVGVGYIESIGNVEDYFKLKSRGDVVIGADGSAVAVSSISWHRQESCLGRN